MRDRELPKQARRRLSVALDRGAPLIAPLPAQARFASAHGVVPSPRWRLRALTVAVAAVGIAVVAFAGQPQARDWIVESVNGISKQVGIPAGSVSPSPKEDSAASGQKKPNAPIESPETPEATAEPSESPEPAQTPPSPTSGRIDGNGDDPSPAQSPSSGD